MLKLVMEEALVQHLLSVKLQKVQIERVYKVLFHSVFIGLLLCLTLCTTFMLTSSNSLEFAQPS